MCPRPRKRAIRRRPVLGAAVLEAALILPSFLFLFVGLFDISQLVYMHQIVTERTRWAARTGSIRHYTVDQIKNLVLYRSPTVNGRPLFNMAATNVTVQILDTGETSQRINVTVSRIPYSTLTPLLPRVLNTVPIRVSTANESP